LSYRPARGDSGPESVARPISATRIRPKAAIASDFSLDFAGPRAFSPAANKKEFSMRTAIPIAAALAAGLAAAPAAAEGWENARTIIVSGNGEATKAPDVAYLTLGVEADGATASEALRKNSAQMEATIKTLRDAGVEKKDIQTSNLSVGARYDYSREGAAPRLIGYQATNTVSVKLRNLEKAGGVIDKAVSAGSNRLDSISFGFADPKPLMNEARRAAVLDARDRAGLYAEAAGVKLGRMLQSEI
jgi:uncharacterized protein